MSPPRRAPAPDPYEQALREFVEAQRAWRAAEAAAHEAPEESWAPSLTLPHARRDLEKARGRLALEEMRRKTQERPEKAWGGH